jgi:hypothetical protein
MCKGYPIGASSSGSRRPVVERHRPMEMRATVHPRPYSRAARDTGLRRHKSLKSMTPQGLLCESSTCRSLLGTEVTEEHLGRVARHIAELMQLGGHLPSLRRRSLCDTRDMAL